MANLPPFLQPEARRTYLRLYAGELLESDAEGMEQLLEVGLAVPTASNPRLHTGVSLHHAERLLRERYLLAGLQELHQLRVLPDFMANLRADATPPEPTPLPPDAAGELLVGGELDTAIEELLHGAREKIRSIQPDIRPASTAGLLGGRDFRAMDRGVRFRTIYNEVTRHSGGAPEWAREALARGSEVRTTENKLVRLMTFDDACGLVPADPPRTANDLPRAWLVRDRATLDLAHAWFDALWTVSRPWTDHVDTQEASTPRQRAAMERMLAGATQQTIADEMQVSAPYLNGHLKTLTRRLGLENPFQLGAWWGTERKKFLPSRQD